MQSLTELWQYRDVTPVCFNLQAIALDDKFVLSNFLRKKAKRLGIPVTTPEKASAIFALADLRFSKRTARILNDARLAKIPTLCRCHVNYENDGALTGWWTYHLWQDAKANKVLFKNAKKNGAVLYITGTSKSPSWMQNAKNSLAVSLRHLQEIKT